MRSFRVSLLIALLAWTNSVRADDAAPPDDSTNRYANEIRGLKDRISWRKESLQRFANDFHPQEDFIKGDLRVVTAEYEALIHGMQKALDAFRKGDADTARALAKENDRRKESRDWGKRFAARRQQAENWPTEKWAEEIQTKWGGVRARNFAPEWVQSKRRASAAWGRYAESFAPGVEREKQLALEDAAHLAEAEIRAAEERWRIRQTLDDRLWDKSVTTEELERKIREFEKLGDKTIEIIRARAESERRLREWQRERSKAEQDIDETFKAAREQQQLPPRKKRNN
jgi:hypothetical protein